MTGQSQVSHTLESEHRIQSYIDSLLFESPQSLEPVVEVFDATVPSAAGLAAEEAVEQIEVDKAAIKTRPAHSGNDSHGDSDQGASSAKGSAFVRQLESLQRGGKAPRQEAERIDRRPQWGRDNFSCLTFNVSGLKLALPTQFIDGMQPLDLLDSPANDEFEFASPMFIGTMLLARGEQGVRSVTVVDTARVTMPERYSAAMQESYRYVLTLKDSDWCIAVDSVGGELSLASQQVRWRSEHTRREWLAGTVVDKMCALIDIDALNRHLLAERVLGGTD